MALRSLFLFPQNPQHRMRCEKKVIRLRRSNGACDCMPYMHVDCAGDLLFSSYLHIIFCLQRPRYELVLCRISQRLELSTACSLENARELRPPRARKIQMLEKTLIAAAAVIDLMHYPKPVIRCRVRETCSWKGLPWLLLWSNSSVWGTGV